MTSKKDIIVRKGDIFLVDLGSEQKGSIQKGIRPCIIVQSERGNRHSTTTLIVPLSTHTRSNLPMHVEITNNDLEAGYLLKKSIAMCEQIRIIEKDILIRKLGRLTTDTIDNINKALMIALGHHYNEAVSI